MNSGGGAIVAYPLFQTEDGGASPTSPLQMEVVKINGFKASELNKEWHSRLPNIHPSNIFRNTYYVCYGAEYNNKYYACAIWSSPVAFNRFKDARRILELRRMAISNEAPPNTASWMIGVMRKLIKKRFPKINRLISYQDTEVHLGTIYKASGWKPSNKTKYTSWNNRDRNKPQSTADKIRWEYCL